MSWSDRTRRRLGIAAAAVVIGVSLGGCTFAPVYGTNPATGRSIMPELAAITIETPSGRVEQVVRNALLFAFTGGGPAASPRYNLRLSVSTAETLVGVTRIAVAPSYSVDVAVAYEFSDLRTRTVITRGVARGVASYDRSNQGFANERAKREAEDRAAASAADEIRLRIAADLARPR
jgi:LPS-assembly lipoprotein